MGWIFFLWVHLMTGFCSTQKLEQPINPFDGYSYQVKHQSQHAADLINYAPFDSEEDSEDSDDQTDSAYLTKDSQEPSLLNYSQNTQHIFAYRDHLSQAHLSPILTPPDTYTKS